MTPAVDAPAGFLADGGEMGALVRGHDWSATPLGDIGGWSPALRTAVQMVLASPLPTVLAWGPEFTAVHNQAYRALLGDQPDALGRPLLDVWAEVREELGTLLGRAFAGEAVRTEGAPFTIRRHGRPEEAFFDFGLSPVRDEAGAVAGVLNVAIETTGQVRALAELREGEARFRALVAAGADIVYRMSPDWVEMRRLYGRGFVADAEAPPMIWLDHIFPEDRPSILAAIDAAIGSKSVFELEHRFRRADGTAGWTMSRAVPVLDADGIITEWFGMATDVTERRLATERLRADDARRDALLALGDALRDLQHPGDIAFAAAGILGRALGVRRVGYAAIDHEAETLFTERSWAAAGVQTLDGPLSLRDYGSFIDSMKRGEFIAIGNVRLDPRTADHAATLEGHGIRSFVNAPVIEHGRLVASFFLNHAETRDWSDDDLSLIQQFADRTRSAVERARGEQALRDLNETLERQVADRTVELRRFRDIIEATASPICAFDTEHRLIAFNRAHNDEFRRVNGFDTKVGDVFPDLFIAEQRPVMRALMDRALTGERFTVTEEFGRPELGVPVWEISYTPLHGDGGEIVGAFHLANDISDRLRTEAELALAQEALRQSQKMEAMGSLTGGVAHDFNNLLTPIVGSLDMLQRKGLGGEREQRLIAGAAQSAERAKVLVQRLLAFARRQPLQPIAVDMGNLVDGMADLVASTTGPQIRVVVDIASDLPPAKADPNQLEMALLNLAVNARDAMPDGGTLRISVSADVVRAGGKTSLRPGRYVRLSVADTGTGMDAATLARAVEPFFSTKGVGKGTGLGLSMVHGLASQLGGELTISSRPGLGTNIELWLPQAERAPQPSAALPDVPLPTGAGFALLVDDEPIVRLSTAEMLADLGYKVVEAGSAEEALRIIETGGQVDLVITDHLMPGMTGTDFAHAVRADRPALPVLIVSGFADDDGVAPELPRLAKPFRKDELAASVAGLFPASGAAPPAVRDRPR